MINLKWLKYILGVNKKSSNIAVMAEVGKYPLLIPICIQVMSYWHRMKFINTNSLLYAAFKENKELSEKNKKCWL